MREILELAKEKNAKVLLSTLTCKTLDQQPFVSLKTENYPPVKEIFEKAKQELLNGKISNADSLFTYAKELDALRFRAGFLSPLTVLDRDTAIQATKESLKAIDTRARDLGVRVALENMPEMPVAMAKVPEELLLFLDGTEVASRPVAGRARAWIRELVRPPRPSAAALGTWMERLGTDKKSDRSGLLAVVLSAPGRPRLHRVAPQDLRAAFEACLPAYNRSET